MKTILALTIALLAGSAMAQQSGNPLQAQQTGSTSHMIEFNAENLLQTTLGFNKSKSRGLEADNDTQFKLDFNYAYSLGMMPQLQLAVRGKYNKGTAAGRGDYEDYGAGVGAYWNFANAAGALDLNNSVYLKAFLGLGWANTYSGSSDRKDEVFNAEFGVGKRMDLKRFGIGHVVYSPEIVLTNSNSTTGSSLEYSQALEFRILQFSVLW